MKTAEDFARDVEFELDIDTIAKVFTQFAAQEVEAYKKRLKQKLEYSFIERSYREGIEKIIDTTK